MNINPQLLFRAKPSDWKTNTANNHYVYGFYHAATGCIRDKLLGLTSKNIHTITTFTENEKGEIILKETIDIDIDTICKCTGCYDSQDNLLWEKDTVVDMMDKTLMGTITFQHNSIPCVEFNKRPTFACVILETTDTDTTTTILTPSLYKRIIKCVYQRFDECDEKPNVSLKKEIIELLQQDYDDVELSEKLNTLVNGNTSALFKDMPCNINDTVYIASNDITPDTIVKGTSIGLSIGKVVNFMIGMDNTRYIEIATKHGSKLLSEADFKQSVVKTPFHPIF